MPMYREIVSAAGDTATAIIKHRMGAHRPIVVTTQGGSSASVSWSNQDPSITLNLPTLPPDAWMTRAEADRVVGYIAHECCHVVHTDWQVWRRAVHEGPDISGLVNCLEDVRIEKAEIDAGHYPALRGLLGSLLTQKHAEALAKAKARSVTIGACREHMPYALAVLGRLANGYTIPTAHALARDLAPGVRKLVAFALKRLPACQTTEDVRRLAHTLRRMERQAQAQAEAQAKAQPDAGEGQEGQEGAGEAQEAQEGASEGQEAQEGASEGQEAQEGAGEGQEGQEAQEGAGEAQEAQEGAGEAQEGAGEAQEGAGEGPPGAGSDQSTSGTDTTPPDPKGEPIDPDDMTAMLEAIAERLAQDAVYQNDDYSHLLPLVRVNVNPVVQADVWNNQTYAGMLNDRLPHCGVLHGQVARMLTSEEKARRTHHETSGRLDRRALVRMRAGAPDVYSQREDTPAVQTALVLLVDQSGSMDYGNRMPMTRLATWALLRATEEAGARVRVVGFTSPSGVAHERADLTIVKDWDTSANGAAYAVARMGTGVGTPLSPAIITAAEMAQDVAATRRIVMVLTDGGCNFRAPAVTIACRIAASMGVETVGIGMNCDAVIAAFPDGYSVNIEDITQLATTGLGTLVRMLEDADRGR